MYSIPFEKLKLHFTDGVELEFEKRQAFELEKSISYLNKLGIDIDIDNDISLLNELINLYISNEKYKIRHNI